MQLDYHIPGRCDACGRKIDDDQYLCDDCDRAMYEEYMATHEAAEEPEEQAA